MGSPGFSGSGISRLPRGFKGLGFLGSGISRLRDFKAPGIYRLQEFKAPPRLTGSGISKGLLFRTYLKKMFNNSAGCLAVPQIGY